MTKHEQARSATAKTAAPPPLVIRRVEAIPVALPLKKPVVMSGVAIAHAENVLVRIEAADGTVGWGEAASAPTMTGDTQGGLVAAVRHLAPLLVGQDAWTRPQLLARLHGALMGNTGAHSAIEMALLDLAGRASGLPLSALVGGAARGSVAPMWLLGNSTVEKDVAEARAKTAEGFHFFKLKVATKPLEQDIAATHAVRDALGRAVPLCADANCGFALEAAQRYVEATREAGLLFLEQPLGATDLAGLTTLARLSPVADRRRRRHPFAGRHRGACALRRARALAQADQARRLRGGNRGGRPVRAPGARGQRGRQDRRVRASPRPRPCIWPAPCRRRTGA